MPTSGIHTSYSVNAPSSLRCKGCEEYSCHTEALPQAIVCVSLLHQSILQLHSVLHALLEFMYKLDKLVCHALFLQSHTVCTSLHINIHKHTGT